MYANLHTNLHTYMHTYIHTYMRIHAHTCKQTYIPNYTCTSVHVMYMHINIYISIYIYIYMSMYMYMYTYAYAYTFIRMYVRACIDMHPYYHIHVQLAANISPAGSLVQCNKHLFRTRSTRKGLFRHKASSSWPDRLPAEPKGPNTTIHQAACAEWQRPVQQVRVLGHSHSSFSSCFPSPSLAMRGGVVFIGFTANGVWPSEVRQVVPAPIPSL